MVSAPPEPGNARNTRAVACPQTLRERRVACRHRAAAARWARAVVVRHDPLRGRSMENPLLIFISSVIADIRAEREAAEAAVLAIPPQPAMGL